MTIYYNGVWLGVPHINCSPHVVILIISVAVIMPTLTYTARQVFIYFGNDSTSP